jgi:MoxR-like ATPase
MRIELGYPSRQAERELLSGQPRQVLIDELPVALLPAQLTDLQQAADQVYVSPALLDYLQAILAFSRQSTDFAAGLSPRAGLGLLAAAKAWALIDKRKAVLPEDLQAILPAVAGHRLNIGSNDSTAIVAPILKHVPVL